MVQRRAVNADIAGSIPAPGAILCSVKYLVKNMKIALKGLLTGLLLQLAIGPIFFHITSLVIQKTFFDGLVAVFAVTLIDYFYISLSILGIGKLIQRRKDKKILGLISSISLIIFGIITIYGITSGVFPTDKTVISTSIFFSFASTFILAISNPITIIFYVGLFSVKVIEHDYAKHELLIFSLSVGLATFIFMGTAVVVVSVIKGIVPLVLIQSANILVGCLFIVYGIMRIKPVFAPEE